MIKNFVLIICVLLAESCFAQEQVLEVSVEYRYLSEELAFSMLNRSDEKVFVNTNEFNGSRFSLSYDNIGGKELQIDFFTYVQDGKERRNMIPILPHEKIFVTYKLAKLVFSEVSQIKKIRVYGFVAYFVESHNGMRGVYIDKEFKLR